MSIMDYGVWYEITKYIGQKDYINLILVNHWFAYNIRFRTLKCLKSPIPQSDNMLLLEELDCHNNPHRIDVSYLRFLTKLNSNNTYIRQEDIQGMKLRDFSCESCPLITDVSHMKESLKILRCTESGIRRYRLKDLTLDHLEFRYDMHETEPLVGYAVPFHRRSRSRGNTVLAFLRRMLCSVPWKKWFGQ